MIKEASLIIENLKKAKKLIENGWCQYAMAETKDGRYSNHNNPDAAKFCAAGALLKVCGVTTLFWAIPEIACVEKVLPKPYINLTSYNDSDRRTKKQILTLFDKAIKNLRSVK